MLRNALWQTCLSLCTFAMQCQHLNTDFLKLINGGISEISQEIFIFSPIIIPSSHKATKGFFNPTRKPSTTFGKIWHTSLFIVATLSKLLNLQKMPLEILCTSLWILDLQILR